MTITFFAAHLDHLMFVLKDSRGPNLACLPILHAISKFLRKRLFCNFNIQLDYRKENALLKCLQSGQML